MAAPSVKSMARVLCKSDRAFLRAFRGGLLPFLQWTHQSHVRLAYLTTWEHAFGPGALGAVRRDIQHFNSLHHEKLSVGYHETMTVLWMHLVAARAARHGPDAFPFFWAREGALLGDARLWQRYYTPARMFAPEAKALFMEPDLRPLDSVAR